MLKNIISQLSVCSPKQKTLTEQNHTILGFWKKWTDFILVWLCESGFVNSFSPSLCRMESFLLFNVFVCWSVRYWQHLLGTCVFLHWWKLLDLKLTCLLSCCKASLLVHDSICSAKTKSFPLICCLSDAISLDAMFCTWRCEDKSCNSLVAKSCELLNMSSTSALLSVSFISADK